MAKNKSLTFSSSALEKWAHSCGLAFTLRLSNTALVLPDGRMVAGTYADYPQSHVSPSVIRYLFQPRYGAAEMPDAIRITVLADIAGVVLVNQKDRSVRVPARCSGSARFICQLLLANGYHRRNSRRHDPHQSQIQVQIR